MDIVAAESTNLFIGSEAAPRQVVRIVLRGTQAASGESAQVRIEGARVRTEAPVGIGPLGDREEARLEIGVAVDGSPAAGDLLDAEVVVEDGQGTRRLPFQLAVEEPGWRMYLVSHFHYDPVWWNTQAAYTETWGATIQYRVAVPGARPGARQGASRDGPARSRLQVRPRRARLPQAVLGRLSRGPRIRPPAPGRRPARVRGRHLQRAQHEPHERGIDHPQRDLRHRLPARRPGRRAGHRLAARRVRARPAVPRDHGRRRRVLELMGSRPVPRMGSQLGPRPRPDGLRRAGGRRPSADAVPDGVRLDRAQRPGPAHELPWPTTIRPAGGWTPRRRSRRPRPRSIACSPSSPRWRPRRTSCCRSAPTTRRQTSGSARSSATGTAGTSGRSSRWPSRASTSTPCARRRPPRAAGSPRRRAT